MSSRTGGSGIAARAMRSPFFHRHAADGPNPEFPLGIPKRQTTRWKFCTETSREPDTIGAREIAPLDASRALDWSTRPSDILLFPHSPLALADVLSHASGRLDLLPVPPSSSAAASELARENALAESVTNTPVVSLQQRRRRRHPRERVNLLTRHGEEELLERCRALLVENALVKRPGRAPALPRGGFRQLARRRTTRTAPPRAAPALPGPARAPARGRWLRAATRRRPSARQRGPARRAAGSPPDRAAPPRPARPARRPLRPGGEPPGERNLPRARLRRSRSATPSCRARRRWPRRCACPSLPPGFDAALAAELTGTLSLRELKAVLYLLPDYERRLEARRCPPRRTATSAQLRDVRGAATSRGCASTRSGSPPRGSTASNSDTSAPCPTASPAGAARSARRCSPAASPRSSARAASAPATSCASPASSSSSTRRPPRSTAYAHPDLCFRPTAALLRRARHQARLIEDELVALQDWFVLDRVPAKRQLLSLIEELGGSVEPSRTSSTPTTSTHGASSWSSASRSRLT